MIVPDIVVDDYKNYVTLNIRSNRSEHELDIYSTDIGIVYRYKCIQYNAMVHNYVFFVHYYMHSNRWVRWVLVRQRTLGTEVYLKYLDDDTNAPNDSVPDIWYEQLINSYADDITYQIKESFPCPPIVIDSLTHKLE